MVDLEEQIEKACADAERLHLLRPSRELLMLEARSLAAGQARGVLKILLLRAGGERGYRSKGQQADRMLCRYGAPSFPAAVWTQGVRVARLDFRLSAQPALAGIKHLNRLEQVLAARELAADAPEGLVSDDAGRPQCGTRTNLFWVAGGTLRTPPVDRCGVAGLVRQKVLAAAAPLAVRSEIGPGSWEELEAAEEAFVTNSVNGIVPLAAMGGHRWGPPGAVTLRFMDHLRHPRLVER